MQWRNTENLDAARLKVEFFPSPNLDQTFKYTPWKVSTSFMSSHCVDVGGFCGSEVVFESEKV